MKEFLKNLLSRKLIIWVVATVALFMGLIEGWIWGAITATYMGANLLDWQIIKKHEDPGSKGNGSSYV